MTRETRGQVGGLLEQFSVAVLPIRVENLEPDRVRGERQGEGDRETQPNARVAGEGRWEGERAIGGGASVPLATGESMVT